MASTQFVCPHCGSTVTFGQEIAAGSAVQCLICMQSFAATPIEKPRPKLAAAAIKQPAVSAMKAPAKSSVAPPKAAVAPPQAKSSPRSEEPSQGGGGGGAMIAIAAVMFLLIAGGVGFAVWQMNDSAKKDGPDEPGQKYVANNKPKELPEKKVTPPDNGGVKPEPEKKEKPPKNDEKKPGGGGDDDPPEEKKKKPKDDDGKGLVRKEVPKVVEKEPEVPPIVKVPGPETLAKPIAGLTAASLNGAVDRGVAFLRRTQQNDGSWPCQNFSVGYASFCGLTLVECKVPPADPAVQRAAAYVREHAPNAVEGYEVSTAILFLDRLGEPKDRPLIQNLAIRLLCGQNEDASWGYKPPQIGAQESGSLLSFLQSHKQPNGKAVSDRGAIRADTLSAYLQTRVVVQNQGRAKGAHIVKGASLQNTSDHSNTQFALLALWAARRHDVPTDHALLAAYQRFVFLQDATDGGWAYTAADVPGAAIGAFPSSNTMTCVGLLALALGHGVAPEYQANPKNPKERMVMPATKDPRIHFALRGLARWVGNPVSAANVDSQKIDNLYFMWSVERVGVLYELEKIDGKDWYPWGAQILVARQGPGGEWPSVFYPGSEATANTCFALLFLKRSNLVQDLTTTLNLSAGIRDPEK